MEIASLDRNEMTMLVAVATGCPVIEVGAIAPLADSANRSRGERTIARNDLHGAHGAIGIHSRGESNDTMSADIRNDRIHEMQRRSRRLDAAFFDRDRDSDWEARGRSCIAHAVLTFRSWAGRWGSCSDLESG